MRPARTLLKGWILISLLGSSLSFALEPNVPSDLPPQAMVEGRREETAGDTLAGTPVYHLQVQDKRVEIERSPWDTVAAPFNVDPGAGSYRDEPVWEPGVVVLSF